MAFLDSCRRGYFSAGIPCPSSSRWVLWSVFLLLILWVSGVSHAQTEIQQKGPRNTNPFLAAESRFFSGKFMEAKHLYHRYLNLRPEGKYAPRAWFRLGQIDQRYRTYSSALKFYQTLEDRFPNSYLATLMKFNKAQCLFEMGRYPEAETLFHEVGRTSPDSKKRWETLLYLGRMEEKRMDYEGALENLLRVYRESGEEDLKNYAGQLVKEIIDRKITQPLLISLARQYPPVFPLDEVLLKLASRFRIEGDVKNYRAALGMFLRSFPTHPERKKIEMFWRQVNEEREPAVRLGVVLPLTGRLALTGQQVLQGIQLAVNQMDAQNQNRLELVVKDSAAGRPVTEVIEELAADPLVGAILGPVLSEHVKEGISILEAYQIPVFTPTASASGLADQSPYIFRNALTRSIQAKFLADYAVNNMSLRRFVILYPLETFGQELRDVFTREVESFGGEVVASVPYSRQQTDFKEQILQIGGIPDDKLKKLSMDLYMKNGALDPYGWEGLSRPVIESGLLTEDKIEDLRVSVELSYDAIFLPGFYDKVGLILPQLAFYNIENAVLLGTNGWNSPELVKIAGNYLGGEVFVDGFFVDSQQPRVREFVGNYKATFGENPTALTAQSYDAARILIQIVLEGGTNRRLIKEKLQAIHGFPGVSGTTSILPSGDSEKLLFTLGFQNKKIVQVQ